MFYIAYKSDGITACKNKSVYPGSQKEERRSHQVIFEYNRHRGKDFVFPYKSRTREKSGFYLKFFNTLTAMPIISTLSA